jgi:FkbM family methyltransferase
MSHINRYITEAIRTEGMVPPTIATYMQPTFAQAYEDVILQAILNAEQTKRKEGFKGLVFVEIGANHPVNTSPSYYFEKYLGVQCVLVEANPALIDELMKHRKANVIHAAITNTNDKEVDFHLSPDNEISSINKDFVKAWKDGKITDTIKVPAMRINEVLYAWESMILSIDVEGHDYEILTDINFDAFKPLIIMIEPSEEFAPGTVNRIMDHLTPHGYQLVARTFVNLIFKLAS